MDYPDKQFEGWTPDDFASYSFSPHRYSFFAGSVFLVAAVAMYAVGNLGVLRWITPSEAPLWHRWSIAVLFGLSLVFLAWARKKDMAAREACSACGEEMTVLYTFPFRAETGKHRIGKSGHHYHLFRMPGSVAYHAEEHRLRWLVCEKCRRYANKPALWIIDLGEGEEAIDRQEITYARIGLAQDRLAHAMTKKRPRRTAMKKKL